MNGNENVNLKILIILSETDWNTTFHTLIYTGQISGPKLDGRLDICDKDIYCCNSYGTSKL